MRPKHQCRYGNCHELTDKTYCPEHEKQVSRDYDKKRGNFRDRGYSSAWDKTRLLYLKEHPICEACEERGRFIPAKIVHHLKAVQDGGELLDFNNLRSLCNDCHENIHGHDRFKPRLDKSH
jgi:5-methylcytosine-specific restriction protein A